MNLSLYSAAVPLQMQGATPPPPLTDAEKQQWNKFLDYIDQKGFKGSPELDARDKQLGAKLMAQYKSVNPDFSLTYDRVGDVQKDLQDYRQQVFNDFKAGKVQLDPSVKSVNDIMSGLSSVDGWLGSKTSSYKFPTASASIQGKKVNYGTNVNAYDAAMAMAGRK